MSSFIWTRGYLGKKFEDKSKFNIQTQDEVEGLLKYSKVLDLGQYSAIPRYKITGCFSPFPRSVNPLRRYSTIPPFTIVHCLRQSWTISVAIHTPTIQLSVQNLPHVHTLLAEVSFSSANDYQGKRAFVSRSSKFVLLVPFGLFYLLNLALKVTDNVSWHARTFDIYLYLQWRFTTFWTCTTVLKLALIISVVTGNTLNNLRKTKPDTSKMTSLSKDIYPMIGYWWHQW